MHALSLSLEFHGSRVMQSGTRIRRNITVGRTEDFTASGSQDQDQGEPGRHYVRLVQNRVGWHGDEGQSCREMAACIRVHAPGADMLFARQEMLLVISPSLPICKDI